MAEQAAVKGKGTYNEAVPENRKQILYITFRNRSEIPTTIFTVYAINLP